MLLNSISFSVKWAQQCLPPRVNAKIRQDGVYKAVGTVPSMTVPVVIILPV